MRKFEVDPNFDFEIDHSVPHANGKLKIFLRICKVRIKYVIQYLTYLKTTVLQ